MGTRAEIKAAADFYGINISVYNQINGTWMKQNFISANQNNEHRDDIILEYCYIVLAEKEKSDFVND